MHWLRRRRWKQSVWTPRRLPRGPSICKRRWKRTAAPNWTRPEPRTNRIFVREAGRMTGTPSQIEWAERIKPQVSAEFDRVAKALSRTSIHQQEQDRLDAQAVGAILEEKRAECRGQE